MLLCWLSALGIVKSGWHPNLSEVGCAQVQTRAKSQVAAAATAAVYSAAGSSPSVGSAAANNAALVSAAGRLPNPMPTGRLPMRPFAPAPHAAQPPPPQQSYQQMMLADGLPGPPPQHSQAVPGQQAGPSAQPSPVTAAAGQQVGVGQQARTSAAAAPLALPQSNPAQHLESPADPMMVTFKAEPTPASQAGTVAAD